MNKITPLEKLSAKIFLFICVTLLCGFFAQNVLAGLQPPVLLSITADATAAKTVYVSGEALDISGLSVTGEYVCYVLTEDGDKVNSPYCIINEDGDRKASPYYEDVSSLAIVTGFDTLVIGDQTLTVTVTDDGETRTDTYIVTVNPAPSSDASLSALTIDSGELTPAFSSDVFDYSVSLANNIDSLTVTATPADANATASVDGGSSSESVALLVGDNAISIVVTAEDTTTEQTYTIIATRAGLVIDLAEISGVAAVRGEEPVTVITETDQYTGTVSWSPADSVFAGSTVYTATITITPKDGYTLNGVAENLFTVSGATATNSENSGVVTVVFPETSAAPAGGGSSGGGFVTTPTTTTQVEGDINGDGIVDELDFAMMMSQWGQSGTADLNGDGIVDELDFAILMANWSL